MKRNLISVIILALSIVNFILLAIIVFTVIPTTKKTDNLITSIASIVDLSVDNNKKDGKSKKVALSDLYVYTLTNEDTITLQSNDGDSHYAVVKVALSMNMKSDDYSTYDPTSDSGITTKESVIESTISDIISKYTVEECRTNKKAITEECKKAIQDLFDSDVIYDVSFSKYILQ